MKKYLLSIVLTLIGATSMGQWFGDNYDLNFEDTLGLQHLIIDTVSNPTNIWQVGAPQKSIFINAFSLPNAIVTDTINSYPTNDTSIFIIKNVAMGGGFVMPHTVVLSGEYFVNSDTLSDYGTIEFSPDNGINWIDLINDTIYSEYYWWDYPKPTLTGNSDGWKNFYVNIAELGPIFNIQDGDTILYRFTFISDNVQTNKDGLMFDNFHFEDWVEAIQELKDDGLLSVYPNPVRDLMKIQVKMVSDKQRITIYNQIGQILFDNLNFNGETIDTRQLFNGVYTLKYSDTKNFSIKKFIVYH